MGIRRHQYAKEVEKNIAAGMSLDKAHKAASKKSSVKAEPKTSTDKKVPSKEGMLKKTKQRLKELFYGDRTYLPGHKKPAAQKKKKLIKTTRTKDVEGQLKKAGLSAADIAKFQKKKKK